MLLVLVISYTLPIDSPLMADIEHLQVKGMLDFQYIKPYGTDEILPQFDEILVSETELTGISRKIVAHFGPMVRKSQDLYAGLWLHSEYRNDPEKPFGIADMRMSSRITRHLAFDQAIRFRFSSVTDSAGPKPWKDKVQAYLGEGAVRCDLEKFKFVLGRRDFLLGPGDDHSLFLSPQPEGYDGYLIQVPMHYFEFSTTFSVLDMSAMRFISTHRLGFKIKTFDVGFSESILWAGGIEPVYLNFLLPYYLEQWGIDRDDNIMWSFDAALKAFGAVIYGELLIDDFQYEAPTGNYDEYPDKLAYQFGLKTIMKETVFMKLNYARVDKWVYTHDVPGNVYENDGLPLGFPLGNDADKLTLSARALTTRNIYPYVSIDYSRKGEGSLYVPYETELGPANPPFPSGIVQKDLVLMIGICYIHRSMFFFSAEAGRKTIKNNGNVQGADASDTLVRLALSIML
jgi:hypothetical protein